MSAFDFLKPIMDRINKDGPLEPGDQVAVIVDNGVVVVGLDENRILQVNAIAGRPLRVHTKLPVED